MNILFIHQNFPGQYLHLAAHAQSLGHRVTGMGETLNIKRRGTLPGITTIGYDTPKNAGERTHHYLQSTEAAVRRGQAVARHLLRLKGNGFTPDVICAHPGWGEALFIRDVFPSTPILMYCEYYFRAGEADLAFDPQVRRPPDWDYSVRLGNTPQIMSLITANSCITPTRWQAFSYPSFLRERMTVLHDGINTEFMAPDPTASLTLQPMITPGESRIAGAPPDPEDAAAAAAGHLDHTPGAAPRTLSRTDKIITYVARNLEPCRGFPTFIQALPALQRKHPDLHTLIVGASGVSYSPALPDGKTYKATYLEKLKGELDLSRVHFLGRIPYTALRACFRITTAHVYLSYPFVLSWSVLEAMACECLIAGSDTAPVTEVLADNENGLLCDFFDSDALAARLDAVLSAPESFDALRARARRTVVERYNLADCLNRQTALLDRLAAGAYAHRPDDRISCEKS